MSDIIIVIFIMLVIIASGLDQLRWILGKGSSKLFDYSINFLKRSNFNRKYLIVYFVLINIFIITSMVMSVFIHVVAFNLIMKTFL